jgi:hypothetical protein
LDGLCGLYSIANAFARLSDQLAAEDVFEQAALAIPKRKYPTALWDGLDFYEVYRSARYVAAWALKERNLKISVRLPFKKRRLRTMSQFLDELSERIRDRPATAILSVEWGKQKGGGGHWLVFERHHDSRLTVLDSDGPGSIQKRRLSVRGKRGDRLLEEETILLLLES